MCVLYGQSDLFQAQILYRAFSVDQMGSAHPIHNPTIHVYRNPDSVFTPISYDKVITYIISIITYFIYPS